MLGDTLGCCKIYASEVLQLSENVSFIILTPPTEFVCSLNHVDDGLINKQGMINLPLRWVYTPSINSPHPLKVEIACPWKWM